MGDVMEITVKGELRRIDVRPGDKFVLNVDQPVSAQSAHRLQEIWRQFIEGEAPLLILERGMELAVIREEGDA